MDIGRGLNRYFDALAGTRAPLRDPGVWMPFVIFGLVQGVILLAMAMFTDAMALSGHGPHDAVPRR